MEKCSGLHHDARRNQPPFLIHFIFGLANLRLLTVFVENEKIPKMFGPRNPKFCTCCCSHNRNHLLVNSSTHPNQNKINENELLNHESPGKGNRMRERKKINEILLFE
jgi:hypothetical protein